MTGSTRRRGPVTTPQRGGGSRRRVASAAGAVPGGGEGGFALLVVLLALVGLVVLSTGGYFVATSNQKVSESHSASLAAFFVADAGLERYMAEHQGPTPPSPATFNFPDGTATVTATRLRSLNSAQSVWELRSRGVHTPDKGSPAERELARIAVLDALAFRFPSAFTSPTGITKNGADGTISGYDEASPGDCAAASELDDVAGVAVPTGGYQQNGFPPVPQGNPNQLEAPAMDLLAATRIPWQEVVDGEALQFDYTIPPDSWPDYSTMTLADQPVIYVDGSVSLGPSDSGWGTLVVRGDLTMSGDFSWKGPVLVGGRMTASNGEQTVQGGIITGLNLLLGEPVLGSSVGNGDKTFQFNSCLLMDALQQTALLREQPGTWFEAL